MFYSRSLVSSLALTLCFCQLKLVATARIKRQDFSTATTFDLIFCENSTRIAILKQAQSDALILANAALDATKELSVGPLGQSDYKIDFSSQAALEYFGPIDENAAYQQRVFDTFWRAIQTYRGSGWSDWWYNRRVELSCKDIIGPDNGGCYKNAVGYTMNTGGLYPRIVFCDPYFDQLKSHGDRVAYVDSNPDLLAQNVRNMRSQAVTMLHEWMHIGGWSSEVCQGGCSYTQQQIGGQKIATYKAGRAKLLARKDVSLAVNTNDNYAYFAVSRFMEKKWNKYPQYPKQWDNNLTPEQNQKLEDDEPGAAPAIQDWELDDSISDESTTAFTDALPRSVSSYPAWYQPALTDSGVVGPIVPLLVLPPSAELAARTVDVDKISCVFGTGTPRIADCVHAFGVLYKFPGLSALHGKENRVSWEGCVQSCAISVYYLTDWDDTCTATHRDVADHASAIFEKCSHGGLGTVGGNVPFAVANCPGTIEIGMTSGGNAPTGGL